MRAGGVSLRFLSQTLPHHTRALPSAGLFGFGVLRPSQCWAPCQHGDAPNPTALARLRHEQRNPSLRWRRDIRDGGAIRRTARLLAWPVPIVLLAGCVGQGGCERGDATNVLNHDSNVVRRGIARQRDRYSRGFFWLRSDWQRSISLRISVGQGACPLLCGTRKPVREGRGRRPLKVPPSGNSVVPSSPS
jgi:hypothetical protein